MKVATDKLEQLLDALYEVYNDANDDNDTKLIDVLGNAIPTVERRVCFGRAENEAYN